MSNIPITSLPIVNPLTGEEQVPVVQAGTTKRTTTGAISALPFGQGTGFASGISFITVSSSFTVLPSSRVLAAALPISLTDGGTSAPITIRFSTGTAGYVLTANGTSLAATFQPAPATGVTSVGLSGGTTGLTISNSPITGNGTMTLGGYLNGTAIATSSITSTQIATNTVGFSKIQQAAGLSVIGVAGSAPANLAPITGSAGQTLRISAGGTTAIFAAPIVQSSVSGLKGENNAGSSASRFDFRADSVVLTGTSSAFFVTSVGTTVADVLLAGPAVNGRDQAGVFSAGQFLHFYWITDGSTIGLTVSSAAPPIGPALPSGYKAWAYAAPLQYTSSTAIATSYISGCDVFYRRGQSSLSNGNATSFAAVSVAATVPANALSFTLNCPYVGLLVAGTGGSANSTVHWSTDGTSDFTTSVINIVGFASGFALAPLADITMPNRNQTYYYFTQLIVGSSPAVTTNITRYRISNGG